MISILLPTYNCDIQELVLGLLDQVQQTQLTYEIISMDDHPDSEWYEWNLSLSDHEEVQILHNPENLGRAANRNALADRASFDHLLFLDADSKLVRDDYIKSYLRAAKDHKWVYGGTEYPQVAPTGCELHHQYGRYREALDLESRAGAGARAFRSNNFLIATDTFQSFRFDEDLKKYGHEDSLLAMCLERAGVSIHHIDNPVLHDGLYTDEMYLNRVEESIEHLVELERSGKLTEFTGLQRAQHATSLPVISTLRNMYLRSGQDRWRKKALRDKSMRALAYYKWSIYSELLSLD